VTPGQRRSNLLRQAHKACRNRGHVMRPFQRLGPTAPMDRHTAKWGSTCLLCGKVVWVTPNPLPNEAEIMGEAVALNCAKNPPKGTP